ncbi:MAG: DMT family transporter [Myxococcales bacterium]|nr:DMT family transporter [Myxococcales bacterium]
MSVHLKMSAATLFWGTTPTIGRVLAEFEVPFVVVFGRFLVAGIFLALFLIATRSFAPIPRRHWLRFLALGATGMLLHNGLMFKGLEFTDAMTTSIILGLIAAMVLLLEAVVHRRRPDRVAVVGVLLGFAGTAYVLAGGRPTEIFSLRLGLGEGLIFLSALSWAAYSVLGGRLLEEFSPLLVTAVAIWVGTGLLFPFVFENPAGSWALASDSRAWLLIFLLGFVGSALGFLWYYEAVVELGGVGTALYINLVPIYGLISAALFLGERFRPEIFVGGAMVVVGLTLVNRPGFLRSRRVDAALPIPPAR